MAIVLVLVSVPGFVFVAVMLGFHTYITAINITTKEFLDGFWNEVAGNPNRKSNIIKNFFKTFFTRS